MNKLLAILLALTVANVFCAESDVDAAACSAEKTPANKEVCNLITPKFTVTGYKCCYVTGKINNVDEKVCLRILDTADGIGAAIKDAKDAGASKLDVQCSASYLISAGLLVLALLF